MKCSIALKSLIISSLFVPVAGVVTLRLTSEVIYGQPFALDCYTTSGSALYATFFRYERASDIGVNDLLAKLGTVKGSTCQPDSLNLAKFNFSCSSDGKEISLIVPAENLEEHNTIWKCANAEGPVMSANNNVTIFVNVPVSSLQLRSYGKVNINEFEMNTFTCITGFCRPQATISWWKNNENITNTADIPTYDLNFTIGSLKYTGNRLDNGHTIVCRASNGYGVERTSQHSVVLNIRYAPDGPPSIGSYSNGSIFSIIENIPQTLSCSITGGNPLASLSWNCFGFVGSLSIVKQTVTSNITLNVNRNKTGLPCQCFSVHELQGNMITIILVQVLYPPTVTPFASPVKAIENNPLEVVCRADGNPFADLVWSPQGDDTMNKSRLYYHAVIRINSGTHSCTASSTLRPTNGTIVTVSDSKDIIIDVLYPPDVTPFVSPVKVVEHDSLELMCRSDGNPSPDLMWSPRGEDTINKSRLYYHAVMRINSGTYRCTASSTMRPTNGKPVNASDVKDVVIDVLYPPVVTPFASPVKAIESNPLEVVCRSDGNPIPDLTWSPQGEDTKNKSRLYYHIITRSNNGTYRCTANSTMSPMNGNPVNVLDVKDVVIDVLYPPTQILFTMPEKVIEGHSLEVICRADGNPTPGLTWIPLGEDVVNKSRLYYHAITRNNSGTFRCTANSTMRPTNGNPVNVSYVKDLVIDVLYRASISAFTVRHNSNTIMENDSLELHCQVDSNPYSDIFLYHEDTLQLMKQENALKLNYTKTVGCLDRGKYTCHANNSIMHGNSVSSDLQMMVACSPRLDHRKSVSTVYYAGLNSSVTLEVFVIAYPEPTNITWYHRENETDMWQRVTYQPPVPVGLFSSILIMLTSQRDFGYYMVTMDNYLGNFSYTYRIIPESIPEVPKNFSVTEIATESLTLEWAPGFDGGHLQHFIIEYTTHLDGDWLKSNAILDVGSPKQSFVLPGLQKKTTYQLRIYAENKIGPSEKTQVINATTSDSFADEAQVDVLPVGAIAGGVSGAVVAVVLVIVLLIFWRRRGLRSKDKDMKQDKIKRSRPVNGFVDNPVYDSSGPIPGQSVNSNATGDEYAEVVKPKKKDAASTIYAYVDKTKKNLKQGAEKGKHGKTSRGDIYENADLVGKRSQPDNLYHNSRKAKTELYCENLYEDSGATASNGSLNKDGLQYAELMLDPPTRKNGKVVIRGIENRTEYAEIAYGEKGEPLPESDQYKTSDAKRADQ